MIQRMSALLGFSDPLLCLLEVTVPVFSGVTVVNVNLPLRFNSLTVFTPDFLAVTLMK